MFIYSPVCCCLPAVCKEGNRTFPFLRVQTLSICMNMRIPRIRTPYGELTICRLKPKPLIMHIVHPTASIRVMQARIGTYTHRVHTHTSTYICIKFSPSPLTSLSMSVRTLAALNHNIEFRCSLLWQRSNVEFSEILVE